MTIYFYLESDMREDVYLKHVDSPPSRGDIVTFDSYDSYDSYDTRLLGNYVVLRVIWVIDPDRNEYVVEVILEPEEETAT